jgi:putative flippase GtrA
MAGLAVNFLLSKALVFKGSESGNSNEVEFLLYAVIGVIGLGLTEMIMYLFTEKLSLYFMVSKVIAAVVVLIWNFAARKITLYRK